MIGKDRRKTPEYNGCKTSNFENRESNVEECDDKVAIYHVFKLISFFFFFFFSSSFSHSKERRAVVGAVVRALCTGAIRYGLRGEDGTGRNQTAREVGETEYIQK